MKKMASIILLGILLCNWFGYRLVSAWMEDRADQRLESQLEHNEYQEADLVSVKFRVSYLDGYTQQTSFERCEGQVEIGGIFYKFVKRRLVNDSLELLCIPDREIGRIRAAKAEFFKLVNDLPGRDTKKGGSRASKTPQLSDYEIESFYSFSIHPTGQSIKNGCYQLLYSSICSLPAERPPGRI